MPEDVLDASTLGFDDEPILPDGWDETTDIFADADSLDDAYEADGPADAPEEGAENENADVSEDAPTTDEDADEGASADEESDDPAPDGEQPEVKASPRILKLKFNHKEEDFDVSAAPDEELATYIQKAKAFDAMKDDQMKARYRSAYEEQIASGMTESVAKIVAAEACGGKHYALEDEEDTAEEAPAEEPAPAAGGTDFTSQVKQLRTLYPDVRGLPDEVIAAAMNGVDLVSAYSAYRVRQSEKTAAATRKENEILKHNAASAARAPVGKGVTGGGSTKEEPKSDFERGFDSDTW